MGRVTNREDHAFVLDVGLRAAAGGGALQSHGYSKEKGYPRVSHGGSQVEVRVKEMVVTKV